MQRRSRTRMPYPVLDLPSEVLRPPPLVRPERHCGRGSVVKRFTSESGQTLVSASLCLSVLLGFVALAVDVGLLWRAKRVMQTAADGGAMNSAAEIPVGDWNTGAKAGAALNGVTDGVGGATVTVNKPPLSGAYAGNTNYVEVIATQSEKTIFMGVAGFPSINVSARAVAYNTPSKDCVVTLGTSPSPPGASGAGIAASGSGSLSVPSCGIVDNASGIGNSDGAINLSGSASITAGSVTTAGNVALNVESHITATNPSTVTTGLSPVSDPLAGTVSPPSNPGGCLANPNINSSTTIGPSADGTICYNSLTIGGGTVTLRPGVYYINGNLTIQGSSTLNGTTGVTFYIACNGTCASNNGVLDIQGGSVTLNLTAPTSGSYKGILFYQNPNDPETATFGGGAAGNINGILYFPDAGLTMTGGSGTTFNIDLVVNWLNITGPSSITPYAPLDIPSPIPDPVLAE